MRLIRTHAPDTPLPPLGLDYGLSAGEEATRSALQAFADTRLEPAAAELDRLEAAAMVAPDSPWWALVEDFMGLGIDVDAIYLGDKVAGNRLKSIAFEELGRGDSGFATGMMVAFFPYVMLRLLGHDALAKGCRGRLGCWIATQTPRGSDVGDVGGDILARGARHALPELYAEAVPGGYRVTGRSSPWVSLGPVAQDALAYLPLFEDGRPRFEPDGTLRSVALLIPLDRKGVSRGPALDKLGQRPLPQGRLLFDGVEVPNSHLVAAPDAYRASMLSALCEGNQTLGAVFTGVARRSLEHALDYTHARKQGGVPIAEHQMVGYRLYDAFRELQAMRALNRQVFHANAMGDQPSLLASVASKTFVTERAIKVAADCLHLMGGNGLRRDRPAEKLLRDARAAVTEDGDNHILSLLAGRALSRAWVARSDPPSGPRAKAPRKRQSSREQHSPIS